MKATIKQEEGYSLFINGQPWESGEELEIPITDPVTVIPVRLAKEETYVGGLFWDGRSPSLKHQAGEPFLCVLLS